MIDNIEWSLKVDVQKQHDSKKIKGLTTFFNHIVASHLKKYIGWGVCLHFIDILAQRCVCESFTAIVLTLVFLNLFLANVPILYPMKTPKNLRFSGVFSGYKMGTLARNVLTQFRNAVCQKCNMHQTKNIVFISTTRCYDILSNGNVVLIETLGKRKNNLKKKIVGYVRMVLGAKNQTFLVTEKRNN